MRVSSVFVAKVLPVIVSKKQIMNAMRKKDQGQRMEHRYTSVPGRASTPSVGREPPDEIKKEPHPRGPKRPLEMGATAGIRPAYFGGSPRLRNFFCH